MAGYMLIERKMLQPHKADGIMPNAGELGFLDYLRELRQEVFPFALGTKLRVTGFEEFLLAADNRGEIADEIHRMLAARANELERMGGFVQVVFDFDLHYGQDLSFRRGLEDVPLRAVFGHVRRERDGTNIYYLTGFNLT
jgi:hypothetical protein